MKLPIKIAAAMCGCLLAGIWALPRISVERDLSDDPDQAVFRALGAFRIFAVDALWMRMSGHVSEGRDGMVLADARTLLKLEPRSSEIRNFLHWHLSFNMALRAISDESRARWFEEGLDIQEEGLLNNPDDPVLNRGLGMTFFMRTGDRGVFRETCLKRYGKLPVQLAHVYLEKAWLESIDEKTLLFLLRALADGAAAEGEKGRYAEAGRLWAKAAEHAAAGLAGQNDRERVDSLLDFYRERAAECRRLDE